MYTLSQSLLFCQSLNLSFLEAVQSVKCPRSEGEVPTPVRINTSSTKILFKLTQLQFRGIKKGVSVLVGDSLLF